MEEDRAQGITGKYIGAIGLRESRGLPYPCSYFTFQSKLKLNSVESLSVSVTLATFQVLSGRMWLPYPTGQA